LNRNNSEKINFREIHEAIAEENTQRELNKRTQ
jgi:hypothetical protein